MGMDKKCPVCQTIESGTGFKIYEDDKIIAVLDENPVTDGHIIVMPKEHYPIIEQAPDFVVEQVFRVVNKVSVAAFEVFGAHGTNILVDNGIAAGQELAHFMVNVIPRKQNDGLDFVWQPRQLSEEEMATIELNLKEQTESIGEFQQEKKTEVIDKDKEEEDVIREEDEEENYMLKQLRRLA